MQQVPCLLAKAAQGVAPIVAKFRPDFLARTMRKWRGCKTQHQHNQSAKCQPGAASCNTRITRHRWMSSRDGKQHRPQKPSCPKIFSERHQRNHCQDRRPSMQPRRKRMQNVAAIQLPARQQIERGRKHSHPGRRRNRVQRQPRKRSVNAQQATRKIKNQRITKLKLSRRATGNRA